MYSCFLFVHDMIRRSLPPPRAVNTWKGGSLAYDIATWYLCNRNCCFACWSTSWGRAFAHCTAGKDTGGCFLARSHPTRGVLLAWRSCQLSPDVSVGTTSRNVVVSRDSNKFDGARVYLPLVLPPPLPRPPLHLRPKFLSVQELLNSNR